MRQLIYFIRHGLAKHNENFKKYGEKTFYDPNFTDTKLIREGINQSKKLSSTWEEINNIELVLVSPLYRTLETANIIFNGISVPIISLENLREYPMGEQTCNKRSDKKILLKDFPNINFDNIKSNNDILWDPNNTETIESLDNRINEIKKYIKTRNEKKICIISHTIFIEKMKNNTISLIEKGESEIDHCIPYKMYL